MRKTLIYLTWFLVAITGTLWAIRDGLPPSQQRQAPPSQRILPQPPPATTRAPQAEIDRALFSSERFFGSNVFIAKPTREGRESLARLTANFPQDPRLQLIAAQLDVRLGEFDRAANEMRQYAGLEGRQPSALRTLAIFYNSRGQFADEVRTLMELARQSPALHRRAIHQRVITVVRDHRPQGLDADQIHQEMIAANPKEFQFVQNYIEDLLAQRREDLALSVIKQVRPRFPNDPYLLKTEANIYLRQNRPDAALAVYEQIFEPLWPPSLSNDYYALLKQVDRYRAYRRSWRNRYDSGTAEFQTVGRLFNLYVSENNLAEASRVLQGLEKRKADGQSTSGPSPAWPPTELETTGAMYATIGNYDQASRYYYTLYLMGAFNSAGALREQALQRLFRALMEAQNRPTRVAAGDLSLYRDIAIIDQHPGMLNGVLSLILADAGLSWEFAQREESAKRLFNSLLAYRLFEAFKRDYPQSLHLPAMYLGMIDTFVYFKRYELAVQLGEQFLKQYPESPEYERVSLAVADAYRELKNYRSESQVYQTLLDRLASRRAPDEPLVPVERRAWSLTLSPQWAAQLGHEERGAIYVPPDSDQSSYDYSTPSEGIAYHSILGRYVQSLAQHGTPQDILRLYWSEIQKHPKEGGLYETFLRWLEQTNLFNDKLRAHQQAIRQFQTTEWHHRLARWLIRERRAAEFRQYSREIAEILDDDELQSYLQQFIAYSSSPSDQVNYDAQFYLQLYRFALSRFPHNLNFVHKLLDYYRWTESWIEWERLATQYYFADTKIRDALLARWSNNGTLKALYKQAQQSATNSLAYRWFAADTAIWMCRYEEGVAAYSQLAELYPGDPTPAERLATLLRSLGQKDEKNFAQAGQVLSRLADIYPTHHEYRTKAGEVYTDYGDLQAASKQWDAMLAVESGKRETYLEVASLYWDYFLYDDAIRVIDALRRTTGDDTIYAYQVGAIYEGKRDYQSAVKEYVKALTQPSYNTYSVTRRLAHLARRRALREQVQQAYQAYAQAHRNEPYLPINYQQYLREIEDYDAAWLFLETEAAARNQEEFLLYARNRFHDGRRFEAEKLTLERLIAIAPTEMDDMKYRLQLASFYETRGEADAAAKIIDALVAKYPTNYGVLDEGTDFFWRVGLLDRSLGLHRTMVERARGGYVRAFKLELAGRLAEASRFDEAETVLRRLYAEDVTDMQAFGQLADVLGKADKSEARLELYRTGIANVRGLGLSREAQRDRIAELRRAMISIDTKLGKHTDAIDQHIEIINRDADNRAVVNTAMDYATRYNLADRVIAYYQKTAKESYRDYRWPQVLAWIHQYRGEAQQAAEQYALAVKIEPQRLDLRSTLADALIRLERFQEAIEQLRRGYQLSQQAPDWQVKIAQVYARQGNHQGALNALNEALTSKRINSQNIFEYAHLLESWGLSREAREFYKAGLDRLMKNFYDEPLIDSVQLDGFIRTSLRTGVVQETLNRLFEVRQWAQNERQREENYQVWRVQEFQTQIETALRESFARHLARFGGPAEIGRVEQSLTTRIVPLNDYSEEARAELSLMASLAHNARLTNLEEQVLRQLVDSAFQARAAANDTRGYGELANLINFYETRGAFAQAAATLQTYNQRDRHPGWFDYPGQFARLYRLAGDTEKELAALRQIYQLQSGELTESENDTIARYFTLLDQKGLRDELSSLTQRYNPYQLQLVNFLIAHQEQELAMAALEQANLSPAWVNSRQAQVGYHFNNTSSGVADDFRSSLRLRPIGELIAARPDANQVLIGEDWYRTARVYGFWLELRPETEPTAKDFTVAVIEDHPRLASDQLELAARYLKAKRLDRALAHAELAEELAPRDMQVKQLKGEVYWAQGKKPDAVATWDQIIKDNPSSPAAFSAYVGVLAKHDLEQQALAPIQDFMIRSIKASGFDYLSSLVRQVVDVFDAPTAATLFETVSAAVPSDVGLARMIVEEELLPMERLTPFYRALVIYFIEGQAAQTATYYQGQSGADSAEFWRQRLIGHLIAQGESAAAQQEIDSFKNTLGPSASPPDWLTLAQAKLELRLGRRDEAIARLRQFAVTGSITFPAPQQERFLRAYEVLNAEGLSREANEFLVDMYSLLLTSGQADNANFIGLAEALFNLDRDQEAISALDRMVNRASDLNEVLPLAAEVAFRYKHFGEAAKHRARLAKINPELAENRLELARCQAAMGNVSAALDTVASLLTDRRTPAEVVAMATELVPEFVGDQTEQALAKFSATTPDVVQARVALLRSKGQLSEARGLLDPLLKDRFNVLARIESALIEKQTKNWEDVLHADPQETIPTSLLFAMNSPRAQLIKLYAQAHRPEAALGIARGSDFAPATEEPSGEGEESTDSSSPQQAGEAASTSISTESKDDRLQTIERRNAAARIRRRVEALATLAQAAKALGNYDEALGYLQARLALLGDEQTKAAAQQAIAELKSEKQQYERQAMQRMTITKNEVRLGMNPVEEALAG
jgi:tetratricopeptide (TPR) repeat protein